MLARSWAWPRLRCLRKIDVIAKWLLSFTKFIPRKRCLYGNTFALNGTYYLQYKERPWVSGWHHRTPICSWKFGPVLTEQNKLLLVWWRYIDDVDVFAVCDRVSKGGNFVPILIIKYRDKGQTDCTYGKFRFLHHRYVISQDHLQIGVFWEL